MKLINKPLVSYHSTWILLILIVLIVSFIRFYNFESRINFGPEQAISLITSANYLTQPSFLGLPNVQRVTSTGHTIFSGPYFNYNLVPLLLIFNFDPIPITSYFTFLNLFTGVLIFILVNKLLRFRIAVFSSVLFLFNSTMINHSLFIWIVNYLPLFTLMILYLLFKFKTNQKWYLSLLTGLLAGLSFSLEYMFLLTGLPLVLIVTFLLSKHRFRDLSLVLLGFGLANLPTIFFDLRHNFYHLYTLWTYLLDTLRTPEQSKLSYYHFLHLWPVACIAGGVLLNQIYKKSVIITVSILVAYSILNLMGPEVSFTKAVGIAEGLNYPLLDQAARTISLDQPNNFNVATTFDFNTRAHSLRYLLTYRYHQQPAGVTEYSTINILYVLSKGDYSFSNPPWEISNFNRRKTTVLIGVGQDYTLYKLTK